MDASFVRLLVVWRQRTPSERDACATPSVARERALVPDTADWCVAERRMRAAAAASLSMDSISNRLAGSRERERARPDECVGAVVAPDFTVVSACDVATNRCCYVGITRAGAACADGNHQRPAGPQRGGVHQRVRDQL